RLECEDAVVVGLLRPFGECRRLEGRIIGAVDLDGPDLLRGIGKLLRLGELVRIEGAFPRLERPAAHACTDFSGLHRLVPRLPGENASARRLCPPDPCGLLTGSFCAVAAGVRRFESPVSAFPDLRPAATIATLRKTRPGR